MDRLSEIRARTIAAGRSKDAEFDLAIHAPEDIPYLLEQINVATARAEKAEAERDAANKCIHDTETYFDLGANKFAYRTIKQYTHDAAAALKGE